MQTRCLQSWRRIDGLPEVWKGVSLQPVISSGMHETSGHGAVTDVEASVVYCEEKEEITIFAVNRNLDENVVLTTDLRSFGDCQVMEHIVLECEDLKASNGLGREVVQPFYADRSSFANRTLTSMLHKASWSHVRKLAAGAARGSHGV